MYTQVMACSDKYQGQVKQRRFYLRVAGESETESRQEQEDQG